jgi:peptidyl-prolyl cis-trans isomerase C
MTHFKALSTTALLLAASTATGNLYAQTETEATEPAVATPAVTAPATDTVVIRVNGESITQGQIDDMVKVGLQQMQARGQQVPAEMRSMFLQQAEDNLITQVLVTAAVAKSDIVVSDAEIAGTLEQIKGSIPAGMTLDAALAAQGMSLEELKGNIKTDMAARQLFESQSGEIPEATEADAQAFYDSNTQQFAQPENASASHILIKFDAEETDEGKVAKKAQLETIRTDILAESTTFEDAAKAHSGCPSGAKGGSLGEFGRGQMVPEFETAVFSQDVDSVGEVIETSFGYHIIKVTDRQDGGTTNFDEVKDQIIGYLSQNAQQEAVEAYIKNLRDSATIERVEPKVAAAPAVTSAAVDHSGHNH